MYIDHLFWTNLDKLCTDLSSNAYGTISVYNLQGSCQHNPEAWPESKKKDSNLLWIAGYALAALIFVIFFHIHAIPIGERIHFHTTINETQKKVANSRTSTSRWRYESTDLSSKCLHNIKSQNLIQTHSSKLNSIFKSKKSKILQG